MIVLPTLSNQWKADVTMQAANHSRKVFDLWEKKENSDCTWIRQTNVIHFSINACPCLFDPKYERCDNFVSVMSMK